jgi:uncharacterized membrane protein
MISKKSGVSIAASVAMLALAGAAPTSSAIAKSHAAQIHCYGVNSCKGQSDCKTASNDCRGQNSCKGQGFKELSKGQCAAEGGSLKAPK